MQIASLFASIGADTSGLQKGLKDSENAIKKTAKSVEKSGESFNFAAMATGFNQALEIVNKIGNAIKVAYAAASEGAAIEYAAQKFDNLSRSIGTTSSALLMDLRSAVKGTMSDMELMAGASDMLALGLAKSHDQAVRLTAVAGALGWNLDQLTQTITNETTMRLDSLGLSLESVKGRYEALKAAGIDGQQAMTQALIEAGEAMVNLQGHIGDTTLGAFQKMEAAQTNFFGLMKMELAQGMTGWAEFWTNVYDSASHAVRRQNVIDSIGSLISELNEKIESAVEKNLETADKSFSELYGMYASGTGSIGFAVADNLAIKKSWDELLDLPGAEAAMIGVLNQFERLSEGSRRYLSKKIDWERYLNNEYYRATVDEMIDKSLEWNESIKTTGATYDAYGDQQEAAVRQYEEMAAARQQALADRVIANQESLRQWREELHRTADALRTDLADAYVQVSIAEQGWREGVSGDLAGRLAEDYKNSKISLDKYKESLGTLDKVYGTSHLAQLEFSLGLDELYKKLKDDPEGFAEAAKAFEEMFMPLDAAVQASMGLVGNLQAQLSALERTYNAKVNIVISTYGSTGGLPIGGGGGSNLPQFAHAMGGYELAGQPYLVGEAGPELFIPDTNGRVYSNSSSSAMLGGGNGDLLAALGRLPTASDIALAVRDALLMVGA